MPHQSCALQALSARMRIGQGALLAFAIGRSSHVLQTPAAWCVFLTATSCLQKVRKSLTGPSFLWARVCRTGAGLPAATVQRCLHGDDATRPQLHPAQRGSAPSHRGKERVHSSLTSFRLLPARLTGDGVSYVRRSCAASYLALPPKSSNSRCRKASDSMRRLWFTTAPLRPSLTLRSSTLMCAQQASRENLSSVRFAAPRTYRFGMEMGDDDLVQGGLSVSYATPSGPNSHT